MPENPAIARAKQLLSGALEGHFQQETAFVAAAVEMQRAAALQVLKVCGEPAKCSGCNATIYWMHSKNGKSIPFDPEGHAHFTTCPNAEQFRTQKGGGA